MESIRYLFRNNIRQYAMLIALVVIMAFFQVTTGGILLVPMNVTNLVLQNAYVFLLAIGMTLCILAGGNIDLSVGSLVAFIGALCGAFIVTMKMNMWAWGSRWRSSWDSWSASGRAIGSPTCGSPPSS